MAPVQVRAIPLTIYSMCSYEWREAKPETTIAPTKKEIFQELIHLSFVGKQLVNNAPSEAPVVVLYLVEERRF